MNAIKEIRTTTLLTQEEFAREMGVSSMTVRRWEATNKVPNFKNLRKLIDFCSRNGLKLRDFVERDKIIEKM